MKRALIVIAALCLTGVMAAQEAAPKTDKQDAAQAQAAEPKPATQDPAYVIGPEDVLAISVWKEPDFSATAVPVRPDGKISLPLLHDVQAAGLSPIQLADALTTKLKKYVEEPKVTVVVTQILSRRVFLIGQVKAGAYPLLPNMTVLQALSAAGCCSEFANTKKIYVLRQENGKQAKLPFNYKQVLKGESPEQNIVLQPGDTIVVP